MTDNYPAATPHGDIEQLFEDVFYVPGSVQMAPGFRISRNMIIVRSGTDLTLVSTVRLDEQGLKALEALGNVKHVIKLGDYHLGANNGLDDPFYIDRYQAQFWVMSGMIPVKGLEGARVLDTSADLPFADASLFSFETSEVPEGLILINKAGGILVSCDSLQNWAAIDPYFSKIGGEKMQSMGFIRPANIGPEWARVAKPEQADFLRIGRLEFRHLIPSHGTPIIDTAKNQFTETFNQYYSN